MNARTQEVSLASERAPAKVAAADGNTIMAVIARAAEDPNTDVDKLERLMGLYERISAQQAKAAFTSSLAAMQPRLPVINERGAIDLGKGKPQSYARWEDINDAIRPMLAEHGFALSFRVHRSDGLVCVTGVLSHEAGHSDETTLDLPVDTSGSKNAVQAVGSSLSYAKRYTAMALLNITSRAPGDHDDDGVGSGRGGSAAFQRAIADLNGYASGADLALWKKTQAEGLERMLSPGEFKEVVALYNRRATSFKNGAAA